MDAPLALYRRYRPETFAEVIGQEHVTEPLRHALAANRVNHAYLFSGPRGCGKTTSARILARALNCEKAPISDPCGECQSCRDLARGGPGSIDVIEIDAASHGGVDDARDLRERAFFAPVSSRYKVYIIDEAHMVSPQGFNALLKLVEEPPPHLKFIFATTEPDKVIGTIRSRTHHYPFRLVPPKALGDYLMQLCAVEGVSLAPTALPLVVRAGQGSVRDTLSVLDQLLGGAGPEGVTYELAVALLGYTPDSLLDEAIDAFAARDGSTVFGVVDKVIESGQDPRRFAEDLLQRLRDLVIVAAVPDALDKGLLDVPGDRALRLVAQANGFGPSELTRAADIVNAALMEFRGATAPRLLLELMCARILVPGADNSTLGFQARLDRVERRLSMDGAAPAAPAVTAAAPASTQPIPPVVDDPPVVRPVEAAP
ncbi:MAG: polymerase subunit gamma/tau, partial [Aeromicrobium sp.]|nr:polymerase subunit gamma/tau [Aeromicrobium sp.]